MALGPHRLEGGARLLERERLHLEAAGAIVSGDFRRGSRVLETIGLEHPRDLMALAVGHQVDYFTGDSLMLRDRPALARAAWTPDDPHHANVLGMLAFGLEETRQFDRAFEVGLEAVEGDARDVWAIHAVGHAFEETARWRDGLAFYDARAEHWASGTYFNVHNWWHYALYALEGGDEARPLAIFDAALFTPDNGGLALQMLDASALLWRMRLEGHHETPSNGV